MSYHFIQRNTIIIQYLLSSGYPFSWKKAQHRLVFQSKNFHACIAVPWLITMIHQTAKSRSTVWFFSGIHTKLHSTIQTTLTAPLPFKCSLLIYRQYSLYLAMTISISWSRQTAYIICVCMSAKLSKISVIGCRYNITHDSWPNDSESWYTTYSMTTRWSAHIKQRQPSYSMTQTGCKLYMLFLGLCLVCYPSNLLFRVLGKYLSEYSSTRIEYLLVSDQGVHPLRPGPRLPPSPVQFGIWPAYFLLKFHSPYTYR